MEIYARLSLISDEVKLLLKDARFYIMILQAQLDQLMFRKKSSHVIHPIKLRDLLLEIQESLTDLLSLVSNPKTDLWTTYKYLTSYTFFTEGKIMVILSIPLIKMDKLYDVYQATPYL